MSWQLIHRRVIPNQNAICENGLEAFLAQQAERIAFLEKVLAKHDDGRSKNFFCIAATLISVDGLKSALRRAADGEDLKSVLTEYADAEGQELRLKKWLHPYFENPYQERMFE